MHHMIRPCHQYCNLHVAIRNVSKTVIAKAVEVHPQIQHVTPVEILQYPSIKKEKYIADINQKETKEPEWQSTAVEWSKIHQHYLKLSKIKLTGLVVITTMAGYAIAPAPLDINTLLCCSLGTGLVSSAANTVNQYHEVPFDSQMSRTKNRVLVRHRITPLHALTFATVAGISGLSVLYFGCNGLTTSLGATNLVLYTCIYTPLKRISILNTWVGSVVGSIPPMMGWAACSGSLGSGAWILAGILYAWQFPHFNALSWNLRPDYSRAGYRMMSVTNPDLCRKTAFRYTVAIALLSCCAPFCDVTNAYFPLQSLPINVYFAYLAWKFYKNSDSANSRKLFRFSLIHLPLLMILLLANKKYWFNEKSSDIAKTDLAALSTIGSSDVGRKTSLSTESALSMPNVIVNL